MTSLTITDADIPRLDGKVAVLTGGASGIGLAAALTFANRGAKTYILDLNPPDEPLDPSLNIEFVRCNVASWTDLRSAFQQAKHVDIAVACAGVSETFNYFEDTFDEDGELLEPKRPALEVNYIGVLNFIKLSVSYFRRQKTPGSIVIVASATGYAPEQALPVYSSTKLGVIGLLRALRSTLILDDITINAVTPAATETKLLPKYLATPLKAAGIPVSTPHMVGLAVGFSATATESHQAEFYGKDRDEEHEGRWNGRSILTLGDTYTELEEPISRLRPQWFGVEQTRITRLQQASTDFRPGK